MIKELRSLHEIMGNNSPVTPGCSYPPTDILRHPSGSFTIIMAVAGFEKSELRVVREQNTLVISGARLPAEHPEAKDERPVYIQRGIARRKFKREFAFDDTLGIDLVTLKDGQLIVDLGATIPPMDSTIEIPIF